MGSIGLSMIVKDEPVDRLAMLVEYVKPVVDKVVILDTGSQIDDTELYRSWGVVAGHYDWRDNFAAARNATLDFFDDSSDWILHLDGDELPTLTMMEHLKWIKDNAPEKVQGYQFWTRNFWSGEIGVEAPYHWHARLFRRGNGRWYKPVHEQVEIKDKRRWYREEVANSLGLLVHADKDAYLIHSKPRETMERANELYSKIGEGPVQ
jgi:hypothetical protein